MHPGVRPGSVLSPLLFNVALGALLDCLAGFRFQAVSIATYASDIKLSCTKSSRRAFAVRSRLPKRLGRAAADLQEGGLTLS